MARNKPGSGLEYSPELAERLAQELEPLSAEELLGWAAERFGAQLCLTCSWQKQSSALVHMLSELDLRVDVIELDTELFFRETYALQEGPNLWERDPDRCCHIRKVEPLERALAPYDAWISGVRRDQSPSRAGLKKIQYSERYGLWRFHPFADWNEKRVWAYLTVNEIPYNPLHDMGYRSIGCIPCTRPTNPGEEERAGRWSGSDKLECGIHPDGPSAKKD